MNEENKRSVKSVLTTEEGMLEATKAARVGQLAGWTVENEDSHATVDERVFLKLILSDKQELIGLAVLPKVVLAEDGKVEANKKAILVTMDVLIFPPLMSYADRQVALGRRGLPLHLANATPPRKAASKDGGASKADPYGDA